MKLISDNYIELLKDLHKSRKGFGLGLSKMENKMEKLITGVLNEEHIRLLEKSKRFLDYGCGKGRIVMYVKDTQPNTEVVGYDPGMEEYKTLPEGKFDFVWCTDVLEHIEPDLIENVLNHINELSSDYLYLCVNCSKAKKTLRDGRNAHLIIKPKEWWREHFVKMGNILKEEIRISKWGKQKEFESINYFVLLKK